MMSAKRGVLFSVVFAALTGVTLWVLLKNTSLKELTAAAAGAKISWLAAGLFLMLIYVCLEGLCIQMTMKTMGQNPRLTSCMKYAFIGFYFSGITPSASGGQPVQVYCMGRDRLSLSKSALCLLLISVVYQGTLLLYGGGVYLTQRTLLGDAAEKIKWLLALGAGLNVLLVAVILGAMLSPGLVSAAALRCIDGLGRISVFRGKQEAAKERVKGFMDDYGDGADHIKKNPGLVVQLFAVTLARLTILYLMPYFVAMAFGISSHSAFQAVGLQALLTLAVSSLPFPGAVGISEAVSVLIFSVMFSAGLLIPAMLLVRLISFYGILCIGGLVSAAAFIPPLTPVPGSRP